MSQPDQTRCKILVEFLGIIHRCLFTNVQLPDLWQTFFFWRQVCEVPTVFSSIFAPGDTRSLADIFFFENRCVRFQQSLVQFLLLVICQELNSHSVLCIQHPWTRITKRKFIFAAYTVLGLFCVFFTVQPFSVKKITKFISSWFVIMWLNIKGYCSSEKTIQVTIVK